MDPRHVASAYKEACFEHAPPLKIVHMMYEGALRFIAQAERLDPQAAYRDFHDRLSRAEAVVSELRLCLDHTEALEIGRQLSTLYLFVEGKLREALLRKTCEPLVPAREVLETLLDGWKRIDLAGLEKPA